MADPRFYDRAEPFDPPVLARRLGAILVRDGARSVDDVASVDEASDGDLCFAQSARHLATMSPAASAVLVPAALAQEVPDGPSVLVAAEPGRSFAHAVAAFYPDAGRHIGPRDGIAISPTAQIGKDVLLEPGVVIGPDAEIGDGTHIGANAVIGRGVRVGRGCFLGPQTTVICSLLGDRVIVFAGARVGSDGFGFVPGRPSHTRIPQVGRVILQDDVEIGANCTIDRGALTDTVIGEGTKIGDAAHIGHNCVIGRRAILAGMVGLSGSVRVGDEVVFGGSSASSDHVTIGDRARVAARAGVTRDLAGDAEYGGFPAVPAGQWRRETATLRRLTKGTRRRDE